MNEIEFYNKEFPKHYNDFIYLCRNIEPQELQGCDKEGLITLCVGLKAMELKYYKLYYERQDS